MRAVGIVRVSETGEREGMRSPSEQRERIVEACGRDGIELLEIHEEIDVSGGKPLEGRPGLRAALGAVEAGEAEVVMVAYFDRLFRSLVVQGEVVERVEAAGGRVMALDFGEVSGATAAKWLSGTVLGMMSEYYRRSIGERTRAAQIQAVAAGVWPSRLPFGYERAESGVLVPTTTAPFVTEAFERRAAGASIRELQRFFGSHDINRQHGTLTKMLGRRVYLGEIHFGDLENPSAHVPLVDHDTFAAVQKARVSRGRLGRSDRLLARLGVLRCATCGGRMSVGGRVRYPAYRCSQSGDCPRRAWVMAHTAEAFVTEQVRERLAGIEESASADARAREAAAALERAQADLDAAVRAFTGLEDEGAVRERLTELRAVRDAAEAEAEHSADLQSALTVSAGDWERLTLTERRALIAATVARVSVAPGRGADRLSIQFIGE